MLKNIIRVGKRKIGQGNSCFVIAEMSANHNQDYDTAVKILETAKRSGADAVKLQTYSPDTMTLDVIKGRFIVPSKNTFAGDKNLYSLYKRAYMPWEWQPKLAVVAKKIDLPLFSTAYEPTSLKFLEEEIDPPVHKISSFEMNDDLLLSKMAKTKKPIIMSTGMAIMEEIDHAVKVLVDNGCQELVILRCCSAYPSEPQDIHLQNMKVLRKIYQVPVGLSDHTVGIGVSIAAVALGANVIEKHFTLDKKMKGPDHKFSMEPAEFSLMVKSIRQAEAAASGVNFNASGELEYQSRVLFRRSLYIVKDVKQGGKVTMRNVRSIRPGGGLEPKYLNQILGMKFVKSASKGTPTSWELIK